MRKVLAIILAGGQGSRMGMLCKERPKPLLPFGPGARVIDFTLSNCVNSSIENISVAVDYKRNMTIDYVNRWGVRHLRNNQINFLPPASGGYNGTADAVYQNMDRILSYQPDEVLILAGDHVYQMDYQEVLDQHAKFKSDLTICTRSVSLEEASRFGVLKTDRHKRIVDFAEKPSTPFSNTISMGIYVFKTDVLLYYLKKDKLNKLSAHDFGHNILPDMIKASRAFSYTFHGYWQDIGTVESYYESNMDYLNGNFKINGRSPLLTCDENNVHYVNSSEGRINNSLISSSCLINGNVNNSIIWGHSLIGKNAVVSNSLILCNSKLDDHSLIDHCVLDEDVVIDRVCHIGKYSHHTGKRPLTVISKGSRISQYDAITLNYKRSKCMGIEYYSNSETDNLVTVAG
jgi:glucose-1-phosphate adenylyltransferase